MKCVGSWRWIVTHTLGWERGCVGCNVVRQIILLHVIICIIRWPWLIKLEIVEMFSFKEKRSKPWTCNFHEMIVKPKMFFAWRYGMLIFEDVHPTVFWVHASNLTAHLEICIDISLNHRPVTLMHENQMQGIVDAKTVMKNFAQRFRFNIIIRFTCREIINSFVDLIRNVNYSFVAILGLPLSLLTASLLEFVKNMFHRYQMWPSKKARIQGYQFLKRIERGPVWQNALCSITRTDHLYIFDGEIEQVAIVWGN